ncbi:hypothetical protein UT300003_32550 [Clostridium sardiniense]
MEQQAGVQKYTSHIIYESAFGEDFECGAIKLSDVEEKDCKPIKINLAGSFRNYLTGAGECINAVTNNRGFVMASFDTCKGDMFFVRLLEDSKYYDGLKRGMYVLVESRGTLGRPVANYHELRIKYGESNWE